MSLEQELVRKQMEVMEAERVQALSNAPRIQDDNFLESLIKDLSIPQGMKDTFWAFADKETVVNNLDEKGIERVMMDFDDCETWEWMANPDLAESDSAWVVQSEIEKFRARLMLKLYRSKQRFEREMQAKQIHVTEGGTMNANKPQSRAWFDPRRLIGR